MIKRWNIIETDESRVEGLRASLNISRTICRVLSCRGIDSFEKAKQFFRPQPAHLHDPWLMKDMDKAVQRLVSAFEKKEKVLVFGDYDVDGTTAVATMFRFLNRIHDPALLDFYIPHRYREGYGVSRMGIDFAAANGFTLIISLDCGIKSVELIAYAKTRGIDFIVCDHHLPDHELPDAVAILNPKQPGCPYPCKDLCGCGVGFKLITALAQHFGIDEEYYHCYLDLVATAIAADIVPMTGENRVMAYYGLQKINTDPIPGIRSLIKLGGIKGTLSINNVVFVIAPRINAAGRMDDARKAVQLFIEENEEKAFALAELLHSDNTDRKEADSSITEEALAIINSDEELKARKTTVVFRDHWHKGVVGIVASRLIETYYRPTVVLTKSGDILAGSARSIAGFNLYEAIHACREYLLGYGGHFAAAGLSLLPENLPGFEKKFEETVAATCDERLLVPEILIDAEVSFEELTPSFHDILCQMEPFGPDNMRPVFIARNVRDTGYSKIVKEHHIRFSLAQGDKIFTGIGFQMAGKFALLSNKKPIDLVFSLDENEWNGVKSLQLKVIDLRSSDELIVNS